MAVMMIVAAPVTMSVSVAMPEAPTATLPETLAMVMPMTSGAGGFERVRRRVALLDGSNDVLHENTYEVLAGRYGSVNPDTIGQELQKFDLRIPDDLPQETLSVLEIKEDCSQRQKVHYGKIIEWIVVLGIIEQMSARKAMPVEDARRVAKLHMAARIAELPYLH